MKHPFVIPESCILSGGSVWSDLTNDPGYIYFLIKDDRVMYVGQTVCFDSRFKDHLTSEKVFDRYAFITTERAELDEVEALYIHTLQPSLNRKMPSNKTVNISKRKLLELIAEALPKPECTLKDGQLSYYSLDQAEVILNKLSEL
jgi:excinuclease UvrABC nuclease subunit